MKGGIRRTFQPKKETLLSSLYIVKAYYSPQKKTHIMTTEREYTFARKIRVK